MRQFMFLLTILLSCFTYAHVLDDIKFPSNVRVGVLDNGMRYVLVLNDGWSDVDFALIQRTGSLQEEESQRGLAHFLEHIAFNGSDHFAPGEMVRFCESHGVNSFNANTAPDRTLFYISGISHSCGEAVLDSCMLILRDFACGMSLDPEEIDKERGVIHEEWRTRHGNGAGFIVSKHWPTLWNNSRYGNRLPIGLMDVVDNFAPEALRSYYEKWYYPENQMVYIQIGFTKETESADSVFHVWEEKVRQTFSDIPRCKHPAKVVRYGVKDNKRPIIIIEKSKDIVNGQISLIQRYHTQPYSEKNKREYYRNEAIAKTAVELLNNRWKLKNYKIEKPQRIGNSRTQSYFRLSMVGDMTMLEEAMTSIAQAIEHGFSDKELADAEFWRRDIQEPALLKDNVEDILHAFVFDEPCGAFSDSIAYDSITSQDISKFLVETFYNKVSNKSLLYVCKDGEGTCPTKESLLKVLEDGLHAKTTPYVASTEDAELIEPTTVGSIVCEKVLDTDYYPNKAYNTVRQLTLSNGATVFVKLCHATSKITAIRNSGTWEDSMNYPELRTWNTFEAYRFYLRKEDLMNEGTALQFEPEHTKYEIDTDSLESSLKRLYTDFVNGAASSMKDYIGAKTKLELIANAHSEANDSLLSCVYGDYAPRKGSMSRKDMELTDDARMGEIIKEELSDASAFTFLFEVGEDSARINDLVCKYIASLPSKNIQHTEQTGHPIITSKDIVLHKKMEVPQTKVSAIWSTAQLPLTLENTYTMKILAALAMQKLSSYVREELGATYTPGVEPITEYDSEGNVIYALHISCALNPNFTDKVKDYMSDLLERIAKECNEEDLIAAKETQSLDNPSIYDIKDFLLYINNIYRVKDNQWNKVKKATSLKDIQGFIPAFIENTERSIVIELPE